MGTMSGSSPNYISHLERVEAFWNRLRSVTFKITFDAPIECERCRINQERVTLGLNMVNGAIQILERTAGLNGQMRKAQMRTAIAMLWRFINGRTK